MDQTGETLWCEEAPSKLNEKVALLIQIEQCVERLI
jgi:hypothetical protein